MNKIKIGRGFYGGDYVILRESNIICWINAASFCGNVSIKLRPVISKDDIGNGCGMDLPVKDVEELRKIALKIHVYKNKYKQL